MCTRSDDKTPPVAVFIHSVINKVVVSKANLGASLGTMDSRLQL